MGTKQNFKRRSELGNVFFTLFGAVAVVGVLGAGIMTTMRGPLSTMVEVNRRTQTEAEMSVTAKLALLEVGNRANGEDCDTDGYTEALQHKDAGAADAPTGGGFIPDAVGANKTDPWGTPYGYCAWDLGTVQNDAACDDGGQPRLVGPADQASYALAVISAGPNKQFDTTCSGGASTDIANAGDDLIEPYTYISANTAGGGLWSLKDATTATIDKNIEVTQSATFADQTTTFSGSNAFLDLAAAAFKMPVKSVENDVCNAANVNLSRINDDDPASPFVEICNNANAWVAIGGGVWLSGPGNEIYYTDNVGIGVTDPAYRLDLGTGTFRAGAATLSSATISGALSAGATTLDSATVTGTLDAGATTLASASVTGSLSAGASTLASATVTGTLGAGNTTVDDLTVNGTATLNTGLDVTGDVTITGSTADATADALTVTDSASSVVFTVQNDGFVGIGNASPNDALDVSGNIDATGTLNVGSNTVLGGTLSIVGDISDSNGDVVINDSLDVNGNIFSDNITANGDVTTTGVGNIVAAGTVFIDGGLSDLTPPTCDIYDERAHWDGDSWACVSAASGGSGVGGDYTLTDVLLSGNDASTNDALNFGNIGAAQFCDETGANCFSPTDVGSAGGVIDADGNTQIQVEETTNDDTIRFDTAGVERMVITPTGTIGVGDSAPDGALIADFEGQIGAAAYCDVAGANCFTHADIAAAAQSGGSLASTSYELSSTWSVAGNLTLSPGGVNRAADGAVIYVDDQYIYVFGGRHSDGNVQLDILRASVDTPTEFTDVGNLPQPIANATLQVVGDKIYIYGGYKGGTGDDKLLNTIYSADVSDPTSWTLTGSLPIRLTDVQSEVVGGYVYLFGGLTTWSGTMTSNIYRAPVSDPDNFGLEAQPVGNLPQPMRTTTTLVVDDTVYLIGGRVSTVNDYTNKIYSAPASNPISFSDTGKTLPAEAGQGFGASNVFFVGEEIFMVGGIDKTARLTGIYKASVETPTTWTFVDNLTTTLCCSVSAIIGNEAYIFGGYTTDESSAIFKANINAASTALSQEHDLSLNPSWSVLPATYSALATNIINDGDVDTKIQVEESNDDDTIRFDTAGAERMVVTATGAVGIGDSAPDGTLMLDVGGQIGATEYCDETGANCFTHADISAGGSGGSSGVPTTTYALDAFDTSTTTPSGLAAAYTAQLAVVGDTVYQYGGWGASGHLDDIYSASVTNLGTWTYEGNIGGNTTKKGAATAVIGDNIYLFGGSSGAVTSDDIYSASISSPTIMTKVGDIGVVAHIEQAAIAMDSQYVYLLGGYGNVTGGGGSSLNTVLRAPLSDPVNGWSIAGYLPEASYGAKAYTVGSKIYYIGGYASASSTFLNTLYHADVSDLNSWTAVTFPSQIAYQQLAIVGEYIYSFGGSNGSSLINKIYRAKIDAPTAWSEVDNIPTAVVSAQSFVANGKVHIVGGHNGSTPVNTIQVASAAETTPTLSIAPDVSNNISWRVLAGFREDILDKLIDANGDTQIQVEETTNDDTIRFDTAGTERMVISPTGEVGIGTASPASALDVNGEITASALNASGQVTAASIGVGDPTPDGTLKVDVAGQVGATEYCDDTGADCFVPSDVITPDSIGTTVVDVASIIDAGVWKNSADSFPSPRYTQVGYANDNHIYVIGGYNGSYSNTIYRSDLATPTQFTVAGTISDAVGNSALVATSSNVYVLGGELNNSGLSNKVYGAPASDASTITDTGARLPVPLRSLTAKVIGDYVYVFGGLTTGSTTTNAIYRASVLTPITGATDPNPFELVGYLPRALMDAVIVADSEYVYVIGGRTSTASSYRASIERATLVDLENDGNSVTWTDVGVSFPNAAGIGSTDVIELSDHLYIIGGVDNNGRSAKVFKASKGDLANWTYEGDLNSPSVAGAVVEFNGKVYVISGSHTGGGYLSTIQVSDVVAEQAPISAIVIDADIDTKISVEASSDEDTIRFDTAGAERMVISPTGNVGIGTSTPSYALEVAGDIRYSGTIGQSSDRRLKDGIVALNPEDVLARLDQVKTYSYVFKDDATHQKHLGVMAQELEALFPELVSTANDKMGTKSVNYIGLIPPLVEAAKLARAENAALRADLEALRADVEGLKAHTGYGISKGMFGLGGLLLGLLGFGGFAVLRRKHV